MANTATLTCFLGWYENTESQNIYWAKTQAFFRTGDDDQFVLGKRDFS